MSVFYNDYIVLYYYSRRGVYTTEQTAGWRCHTLSVLLGRMSEDGMEMVLERLNRHQSFRSFRKFIRTPPIGGCFEVPSPALSWYFKQILLCVVFVSSRSILIERIEAIEWYQIVLKYQRSEGKPVILCQIHHIEIINYTGS
jgi:hypothetical protein